MNLSNLIILASGVLLVACREAPEPASNPSAYSELVTSWEPETQVSHFPTALPPGAENVELSHIAPSGAEPAHLQVRFNLPPAKVDKTFNDATRRASQTRQGADVVTMMGAATDGFAGVKPHTLAGNPEQFPADYRVFIFDAEATDDWNSGWSRGIVVNQAKDEVIYYVEKW